MPFKLIVAVVDDTQTDNIIEAARQAGAKGATIINNARGEGINLHKTFLGLSLETQRDVILFIVEATLSQAIYQTIEEAGQFVSQSGSGIVFQLDLEQVSGVAQQFSGFDTPNKIN
ncbi:P-II family nitrogen regulator [Aliikangiella maris]|uniref:P-II family nitrogen regulator n=2 Tax=Aliikangiella maris TaxID=3162458 RepID=A0ABV3MR64_9GAMM